MRSLLKWYTDCFPQSMIATGLLLFILGCAVVALGAQTTFDSALAHPHVVTSTYEGVWIKRMYVPSQKPSNWPLGNQLAVRGASSEFWFYYGFDPIKDGPLISTAEGTPSGRKVRVAYDPVCFYILSITDLGPVVVPTPTPTPTPWPTPSPTPVPTPVPTPTPVVHPAYEFKKFKYGGKETERDATDVQAAGEGYSSCVPYDGYLRCRRVKILTESRVNR